VIFVILAFLGLVFFRKLFVSKFRKRSVARIAKETVTDSIDDYRWWGFVAALVVVLAVIVGLMSEL
jgi:hypothetical protein